MYLLEYTCMYIKREAFTPDPPNFLHEIANYASARNQGRPMSEFMKWLITTTSDHDQEHEHLKEEIRNLPDDARASFANWVQDTLEAVPEGRGELQLTMRLARQHLYQIVLEIVEEDKAKEADDAGP